MHRLTTVALVTALVLGVLVAPAAGEVPADEGTERYVVRLHDSVDAQRYARALERRSDEADVDQVFGEVFEGFAAALPADEVAALHADPRVRAIEPDGVLAISTVRAASTSTLPGTQWTPPWGLDRIDQRALPLSGGFTFPRTGRGVTAYIVDTGIRRDHAQLDGRVLSGYSSIADGRGTADCNGHGTHVAGLVGGSTHGVAKGVTLRPVRVLDCGGVGSVSSVIAGLDWIVGHHTAGQPAVANVSLGGAPSRAVDRAIQAVIDEGVTVVVAAGNSSMPACDESPARVPAALTIAASTSRDARAPFSNYGACVDLFAPGDQITSAWHTSTTATSVQRGTSMAAPHAAGAAALVLGHRPALTPAQVATQLTGAATTGVISGRGAGTPNRLLHAPPGAAQPAPANDSFTTATSVSLTGPAALSGTNVRATKQTGEPAHAAKAGGRSVWWRFTAPSSGTVTLSTRGSAIDTLLAVYTGSHVAGLTRRASNDDHGTSTWSRVSFPVTAGTTYRVAVDGDRGAAGIVRLTIDWSPSTPPANDGFTSAARLSLTNPAALPSTNARATKQTGEPDHAAKAGGRSVWWRFTAPSDGTVTLSTRGSRFDTLLAVYTGSGVSGLTRVAANDDHGTATWSQVRFSVTAGTTYRVAVDGDGGASGAISLTPGWAPLEPPPANDGFGDAIPFSVTDGSPLTGTNVRATKERGEPDHAGDAGGRSVWWRFTAPSDGTLTLSTQGSDFDTLLAVTTGTAVAALTAVAADDDQDGGASTWSRVQVLVTAGTTYQVAVDGYGGAQGRITLTPVWEPAEPSPSEQLDPATT